MTTMGAPDAPDLRTGYPGEGERIGPAWRAAWAVLVEHTFDDRTATSVPAGVLVEVMCRTGHILDRTARGLLSRMRRAGVLDVTYDGPRGEARYRIPDVLPPPPPARRRPVTRFRRKVHGVSVDTWLAMHGEPPEPLMADG